RTARRSQRHDDQVAITIMGSGIRNGANEAHAGMLRSFTWCNISRAVHRQLRMLLNAREHVTTEIGQSIDIWVVTECANEQNARAAVDWPGHLGKNSW